MALSASAEVAPRGMALAAAALAALASGALFARTLAPNVTLVDSGELILAAHGLGVGHPPGFPTYLLLTSAFTHLPWPASIAWRANLASALAAALACAVVVLAGWNAWRTAPSPAASRAALDGRLPALLLPGLLLACGHTLWNYATVAEVYALNTLLLAGLWAATLAARQGGSTGWPWLAALLAGLGLGAHHVTIGLSLPALTWVLLGRRPDLRRTRALSLLVLVVVLVTVAVYAYLPWAALRAPAMNWGDPVTWARFFAHVTGRQYQAFITPDAASLRAEAVAFAGLFAREHGPALAVPVLVLACAGAARLWRRDRGLLGACALNVASDLAFALVYTVAEDKDAYALPTRLVVVLLAGLGAASLVDASARRAARARHALALLLLALPLAAGLRAFHGLDRSADLVAPEYLADLLAPVDPGALMLTSDWQVYAPSLYLRGIEGWRADVCLLDISLLRRSWYLHALDRNCPQLAARVAGARRDYREDLLGWEREPHLYERDSTLNARINTRFQALLRALIEAQLAAGGRAYVTNDVVLAQASPDPSLARALTAAYTLVPRALVFELSRGPGAPRLAPLRLTQRALFDGRRAFPPDDVARLKVLPVYLSMLVNRGQYLAFHGDASGARAAFQQALDWAPDYQPARRAWERLRSPAVP